MMKYKGYTAEVEFDDSVGHLHGRVVNCGPYPIATFEATDVNGIRYEFHRSIDEYLKSCQEDGVEPRKSYSGKLNVRLGPDLHQRVARSAAENRLSLNSWIVQALEQSVSECAKPCLIANSYVNDEMVFLRISLASNTDILTPTSIQEKVYGQQTFKNLHKKR